MAKVTPRERRARLAVARVVERPRVLAVLGVANVHRAVGREGRAVAPVPRRRHAVEQIHPADRKSTRLNSSHSQISHAVFCLKKKKATEAQVRNSAPRRQPVYMPRHLTPALSAAVPRIIR